MLGCSWLGRYDSNVRVPALCAIVVSRYASRRLADQLNEERKGNDASCVCPRRAAYRRLESSSICTNDARDELESGSCNDAGSQRGSRRLDDMEADIGDVRRLLSLLMCSPSAPVWSQVAIRMDDSLDELVRGLMERAADSCMGSAAGCGKNRVRSRHRF